MLLSKVPDRVVYFFVWWKKHIICTPLSTFWFFYLFIFGWVWVREEYKLYIRDKDGAKILSSTRKWRQFREGVKLPILRTYAKPKFAPYQLDCKWLVGESISAELWPTPIKAWVKRHFHQLLLLPHKRWLLQNVLELEAYTWSSL